MYRAQGLPGRPEKHLFVIFTMYRAGMSSHAPPLPAIQPGSGTRYHLIRRARTLSLLSIGWMTVEAGVAIVWMRSTS